MGIEIGRTTLNLTQAVGWLYMPKGSLQKWLSPQKPRKTAEERANEREQQDLEMAMKLSLQEEEKVRAEQMALLSQYEGRRASIEQAIPDDITEEFSLAQDVEEEDEIHSDPLLSSPLSPSLTRQDQQHNNGYLSDEELDDFVQGMLATSSSSYNESPIPNRIRKASGRRGKRSIAEAVAESEDNRRKRLVMIGWNNWR